MTEATLPAITIGLVSVSDRASSGVYQDEGLPALREWLQAALCNPVQFEQRLIPDEQPLIESTLKELADERGCCLVLNLPGRPKSIRETLEGVRADDGQVLVHGVFASVPYCIELMGGPYIETRPEYVTAFRPKKK